MNKFTNVLNNIFINLLLVVVVVVVLSSESKAG